HHRRPYRAPQRVAHVTPLDGGAAVEDGPLAEARHDPGRRRQADQEGYAAVEAAHHLGVGLVDGRGPRPVESAQCRHRLEVTAGRAHPGLRAKAPSAVVAEVLGASDWEGGPGDDGAVLAAGAETVIVGGEAMLPAFVAADPFAAGVAAMLTNVNDLAAMGAEPLALVDTVVASEAVARQALEGLRHASELYRVPVVGGHLTIH